MHAFESRRIFLASVGGATACSILCRSGANGWPIPTMSSKFKLSVITDEISQDFGHALEIASKEFGLGYVELRTLWNKNIINLDEKDGKIHKNYNSWVQNLSKKIGTETLSFVSADSIRLKIKNSQQITAASF